MKVAHGGMTVEEMIGCGRLARGGSSEGGKSMNLSGRNRNALPGASRIVGAAIPLIIQGHPPLPASQHILIDDGTFQIEFFLGDLSRQSAIEQRPHTVSECGGPSLILF